MNPLTFDNDALLKAKTFLDNGKSSSTAVVQISLIDTTVNGLFYKYYEGQWDSIPRFNELRPVKKGKIHSFSLESVKSRQNYFGIYFYGFIKITESGNYIFYLTSDDGSKLAINNKYLIDNDGLHGSVEKKATIDLESGFVPFAILYFENGGSQKLKVEYEGPGISRRTIPSDILFFDIH